MVGSNFRSLAWQILLDQQLDLSCHGLTRLPRSTFNSDRIQNEHPRLALAVPFYFCFGANALMGESILTALYRLMNVEFAYLNKFPAINIPHMELHRSMRIALIGANGSG